ncbi:myb-like DNA-binding domain protein [Ichthyophthirius multifiliis]|uniref:Myb-like DNA-binding domain protein n=1 Tax=Ichthyophthirius multifiliis TaxID=5932 RepID=G0QWF2_ICHMU|nr:myb-like DNA-binding domain protein [Ichthyophthirius multifiliis]EGR30453.1 myb-like DNA-binding domain protein [Ichthyophthirius multifiliis]|eukprot:XP_004032040.1 myb-like DNA-binding domain protein [Ichthyophthirius multifiliis]
MKKDKGKGPWTADEDELLKQWINQHGSQKWSLCAETIKGRSGKQCRERWFNNLNPDVKRGSWSPEEDDTIFKGYLQNGSSWSVIAKQLQGRTENSKTVQLNHYFKKENMQEKNNKKNILKIISYTDY